MEPTVKNTRFDNCVNYKSDLFTNSSQPTAGYETSADPISLASISRDAPIIEYKYAYTPETTVVIDER
jgi:hypothetical protein